MQTDVRGRVETFVRRRFASAMQSLREERGAMRSMVSTDLAARGFGFALNPLDPRFDEVEVGHCKAVLRAKADALFEAYEVYGLKPDDFIWEELNTHQQQLVHARKNSLRAEAGGRAARTGRNPAPDLARAEALGDKIERSTHAFLKSFACEIEKRKHMPKEPRESSNFLNITGNDNNVTVAQGGSVITSERLDVLATIQASIQNMRSSQEEKTAFIGELESLRKATDKPSFLERTRTFLALAASCVQLAPHIESWRQNLENLARTHF